MSRKAPEPVPPATEPTTTMRNLLVSMRRPRRCSCCSCDSPALSVLSLRRILSRTLAYLSNRYRRDTERIWPAPLDGSIPSSRIFLGVSASHSLIWGYLSSASSSRLYLSMSNDSTIFSSSVNLTRSYCRSSAWARPLSMTAPVSRSNWMNWATGKSARLSTRVRVPLPAHSVFMMRRRTRMSTSMPVPPIPMNSVGRRSMLCSTLRSPAPPMTWFRLSAILRRPQ